MEIKYTAPFVPSVAARTLKRGDTFVRVEDVYADYPAVFLVVRQMPDGVEVVSLQTVGEHDFHPSTSVVKVTVTVTVTLDCL